MDNTVLVILVILISVILLVLIGLVIYLLKRKNNVISDGGYDYSNDIKEIKESLIKSSLETKSTIQDSLNNVSNSINKQIIGQSQDLSKFKEDLIDKNSKINQELLNKVDNKFGELTSKVETKMNESSDKIDKNLKDGFNTNVQHLNLVNESLGKITESQKSLDNLNQEVIKFNSVFSNSQVRGRFGEMRLERILQEIFGEVRNMYELQYEIKLAKGSVRPDAVVFLDDNKTVLCIDSKFSFSEYEKVFDENPREVEQKELTSLKSAIQGEIKKISKDYIIKNITYIYALMFIPSDSIYNFIQLNNYLYSNVIEYARQNNVLIVSPSTIQPILANINYLRLNVELSKNIKKVIEEIETVRKASKTLKDKWDDFSKTFNTLKTKKENLDNPVENIYEKSQKAIEVALQNEVISEDELNIKNNEVEDKD